jgi:outer membrane lipase/esterase
MFSSFKRLFGAVTLVAAAFAAAPVHAGPYSAMYTFGDSLSDTGNLQILTAGAFPNPADGPYAGGRFSDGPVWVEGLASRLGVAADAAPFLLGGKNFAVAGARTSGGGPTDPPSLLAQLIGLWTVPMADPNALYVMVAGGNDMRDARSMFPTNSAADVAGRQAAAETAANNLIAGLNILATRGAKNVLIANLPNLGGSPEAFLLNVVGASTDVSNRFNALFPTIAAAGTGFGLNIDFLDMAGLGESIGQDARFNGGGFYGITNVSAPCTGFAFSAALGGTACNKSLFSDALHPSAAAHALLAVAAYSKVPEPSSVLLVALALGLAGAAARRRA